MNNTTNTDNPDHPQHHRPGTRHAPRTMITALLVTIVLAVTACNPPGDGNTTGTTPPPTIATVTPTTPATTPPPTVTAVYQPATENGPAQNVPIPVLPPKAKEFSKEGLIAFTEYWYSTLGYAFETGNPQPLQDISDPGCKTCEVMAKAVVNGFKDGKWIKGGKMVIDPPNATFNQMSDGTYQATLVAQQEPVTYFKADGTISTDFGPRVAEKDILVGMFQSDHWIAMTVEHISGSKKP